MKKTLVRREALLDMLRHADAPLSGDLLAAHFQKTRQIIVSDVAALRRDGYPVIATTRGYRLQKSSPHTLLKTITCKHTAAEVALELTTIVKLGGIVHNVAVRHDLYGEITTPLELSTLAEVEAYLARQEKSRSGLLAQLNNGIHTHLIEAASADTLNEIVAALDKLGFLYK